MLKIKSSIFKGIKRSLNRWNEPKGERTGIFLNNSLTNEKNELFVKDRTLTIYTCGPTVYDHSHLGHARTYIGFDIIFRILENYFNFNVKTVINITDVDDKIIRKANLLLLKRLVEKEEKKSENLLKIQKELLEDSKSAEKQLPLSKIVDYIKEIHPSHIQVDFDEITKLYEKEFWEDMKKLNVRMPHSITRVTEYIPEVVSFIQKIIERGYAYESNSSVYFDTKSFSSQHLYCKLEPKGQDEIEKGQEGEGEWRKTHKDSEKKNIQDFVLWKKSNVGEPSWDSPFGKGRPGWHIECSAMASEIFGDNIDIHCGGVDLRFPHHDNELAQSEAHFDCHQWVNYFLHTGHLLIEGRTMSKSKKNFITIREALEKYTSTQIRYLFLLHQFNDPMEYSEKTMNTAVFVDKLISEFFKNALIELKKPQSSLKQDSNEKELNDLFSKTKIQVHQSLCNNFDTPNVLKLLQSLINKTNSQIETIKHPLLSNIVSYTSNLLNVFGIQSSNQTQDSDIDPILDVFTNFRFNVRKIAREKKDIEILNLCDKIRDQLKSQNIRIEDRKDQSIWKRD